MIDHILVPLDGSPESELILPRIRGLLRRGARRVTLLQSVMPLAVDDFVTLYDAAFERARSSLEKIRSRLEAPGLEIRTLTRLGPPAQTILEIAEEEGVTLIAMGTHARKGLARLMLGSVTEQVLRHSPIPVLATPPPWTYELAPSRPTEDPPIGSLLVPLDGTEPSLAVVPQAVEWAKLYEARVLLLHARAHPGADRATGELHLKEASRRFGEAGLRNSMLLEEGEPVEVILEACRSWEIGAIAMATHGRTGLSRWLHGSVTERVLRRTTVPVLVVRSPRAARTRLLLEKIPAGRA
jgi:nucleotide-binding universal stress UspA family protein